MLGTANKLDDLTSEHLHMVDNQLRTAGVFDLKVIDAFLKVPRAPFVPAAMRNLTYSDATVPLASLGGNNRSLMVPLVLGKIIQALGSVEGKKMLIIGGATGYSAALLSVMGAHITLLETAALVPHAQNALAQVHAQVKVVEGILPTPAIQDDFDLILIEGSIASLPEACTALLKIGGQAFTIIGTGHMGAVTRFIRLQNGISKAILFEGSAAVLPGFEAPNEFKF